MQNIGIIGWRGMVGSVLMERMQTEGDFDHIHAYLFSTSQAGQQAPVFPGCHETIRDAHSIDELSEMDIIITCQGGDYTTKIHPLLRKAGWKGFWIDAASTLRSQDNAIIVLDPINGKKIAQGIDAGIIDFVGGNCTVSLMLMGLGSLFANDLIEWVSSMTYQAASGAGAKNMIELLAQMHDMGKAFALQQSAAPATTALQFEKQMTQRFSHPEFPSQQFGFPLALSLLPWIDTKMASGQSREEWKAQIEANKILGCHPEIPIDGTCVRVSSLRCHSQGFTIKLKKSVAIKTIESLIAESHWAELVPNEKEDTLHKLTPAAVSGTLKIPVGRLRKMTMGDTYLNAFSVGDQLLWGAAEPLRRTLNMILNP